MLYDNDYRLELLIAAQEGRTVFVGYWNDRFRAIVAPVDTKAVHGPKVMDNCKVCKQNPAELPMYAPDMCRECNEAAWARIAAAQASKPGQPGNDVTNVWD